MAIKTPSKSCRGFPPATEIFEAEKNLDVQFPTDFQSCLKIHNGQKEDSAMVWTCWLVPLAGLAGTQDWVWRSL